MKKLEDIYLLLQQSGAIPMEKQESKYWCTFAAGKKKTRVCLLKNKDGDDCCTITNRKERAESHVRHHQKEKVDETEVASIANMMSKFTLREEKKKEVLQKRGIVVTVHLHISQHKKEECRRRLF